MQPKVKSKEGQFIALLQLHDWYEKISNIEKRPFISAADCRIVVEITDRFDLTMVQTARSRRSGHKSHTSLIQVVKQRIKYIDTNLLAVSALCSEFISIGLIKTDFLFCRFASSLWNLHLINSSNDDSSLRVLSSSSYFA
ncbi:hypothetical protein HJC23_012405 [Cyclotella cryptica]|uniref:Uncharacterized protein n=1 Tax=Cyclotella cryptica TaxID=29204 RepID=A0ABD3Q803_9STRA